MNAYHGSEKRLHAQGVLERHADRLLGTEGVVSVGLGRGADGSYVIVIGLLEDAPRTRDLPSTIEGVGVKATIAGSISAEEA